MNYSDCSLTKRTSRTLQQAEQLAWERHHLYVGPEHLLLVLLSENAGMTPRIFERLGTNVAELQQSIETTLAQEEHKIGRIKRIRMHLPTPIKLGRLFAPPRKRLNRRAQHVMSAARAEQQFLKHPYIGTEHILLGLVSEETGVISQLLGSRGVRQDVVQRELVGLLLR